MTALMNSKLMSDTYMKLHNKSVKMDMIVTEFIQNVDIQFWIYFLICYWNKISIRSIVTNSKNTNKKLIFLYWNTSSKGLN